MTDVDLLRPEHVAFILGMWEATMGGGSAQEKLFECDSWCKDLKQGIFGTKHIRLMRSNWHDECDLCLAVNTEGYVYATCYKMVGYVTPKLSPVNTEAHRAADKFMRAVYEMQ